ncbi:MAG: SpoIIE family protein phosphatase [Bacteroidales bacterium]|nr:SpoIIE family protein phosphatase [Bacteroidales bacterium]
MYIHSDVFAVQSSKRPEMPCGDSYGVIRDRTATTIVLADGLGSGIKAHISANMCVARILGLVRMGMTIRESFDAVSATMDQVWGNGEPFAVFTIARILNNGQTTVLSYEMPPPMLINKAYAQLLRDRVYTRNKAIIHESSCIIDKGDALLLVSDGITQAGIGKLFPMGWESEGVRQFLQSKLPVSRLDGLQMATLVHDQAKGYWPEGKGDDCSVLCVVNRRGVIVNLLTGPPLNKKDDEKWVNDFDQSEGIHIISGGSTANMTARILKKRLGVKDTESTITPPSFLLDGCELVTEGMVTLNQVYHLLDEDPANYPEGSPAGEMAAFLKIADRINVWLGQAENVNEGSIEFRQQGLLNRQKISAKIVKRLQDQGKLVVVNEL